jgi:hypothetical protein
MKDKEYGVDYVILPYITGEEAALATFTDDIRSVVARDYEGTSFSQLPIMTDVNSVDDLDLWAAFNAAGGGGFEMIVRQVCEPYDIPVVAGWFGVNVPGYSPYYTSGLVKGYYNDLRGAAEYELLTGEPGNALASTDALATQYILLLFFIILGNVLMFAAGSEKRGGKA